METVSFANEVVVLAAAVLGGVIGILKWFQRMLRNELKPVTERLDAMDKELTLVKGEVQLNGGGSLKDGVSAITRHLGVRFTPTKVEVESEKETTHE